MNPSPLTVRDVMTTALITAKPEETIDSADFEMRLAEIRHIPIVDDRNQLVGIVSNRDILRSLRTPGTTGPLTMRDVMTTRVHTIAGDSPAYEAVETLVKEKIGCLPVEGESGQLIGLVTETDFLRIAQQFLLGETAPGNPERRQA